LREQNTLAYYGKVQAGQKIIFVRCVSASKALMLEIAAAVGAASFGQLDL